MNVPPATRRANLWTLAGLILFSIALALTVYFWMRVTVRAKGGVVDPQRPASVLWQPARRDVGYGMWDTRCEMEHQQRTVILLSGIPHPTSHISHPPLARTGLEFSREPI